MTDERKRLQSIFGNKAKYVSVLADDKEVPWNPLSIGDFLKFTYETDELPDEIDDQVFKKCVTDPYYTSNLDNQLAGTIPSTVNSILKASVPQTEDEFNYLLGRYRQQINTVNLEQLVLLICRAFPAYKPEEVYEMDIYTFCKRVVQSETKLMEMGMLKYPIIIGMTPEEFEKQQKASIAQEKMKKRKLRSENLSAEPKKDIKEFFNEYVKNKPTSVPDTNPEKFVVTNQEVSELNAALTGGEKNDIDFLKEKMLKETLPIYKDYLEKMKHGKITSDTIKTPEQRIEEANKRAIENEKLYNQEKKAHDLAEQRKDSQMDKKFKNGLNKKQRKKNK